MASGSVLRSSMGRLSQADARNLVIARPRKILCIATLAVVSLGGVTAASLGEVALAAGGAPSHQTGPELLSARLTQSGQDLVVSVTTADPVPLADLDPSPNFVGQSRGAYLCLSLRRLGKLGEHRLCLGGAKPQRRIELNLVSASGKTVRRAAIAARVLRPSARKLVVSLLPADASLTPQRYRWQALAADSLPSAGFRTFRLRPVREVGCTGGTAGLDTNGPRGRKIVALTFDDGPSAYTPGFLQVLRSKHVNGTFFEIGQEMAGRTATMRRILAEGNEIGNHTMHHGFYPGYADLAATSARIEAITHFRPCLFRPPGGGVNSSVIAAAGEAGMRTITWDVDPTDWSTPGTSAIYSRIVGAAQPGSIILMHDGGGNRSETLAALPSIIDTLRARGYEFETVTQLLGYHLVYKPYG
jgi:peptidoglycan/xylan/chitin deacetylase (PgdA/CDA1 family)